MKGDRPHFGRVAARTGLLMAGASFVASTLVALARGESVLDSKHIIIALVCGVLVGVVDGFRAVAAAPLRRQ